MEQVNHPQHYNARPDGLECISIIRHYTFDIGCAIKYLWRAGLKTEMGKANHEKEIEDLEKALWYINDELNLGIDHDAFAGMIREDDENLQDILDELTGKLFGDVADYEYYESHVVRAMFLLLHVGLVKDGHVYRTKYAVQNLREAIQEIQCRIENLKQEDKKEGS